MSDVSPNDRADAAAESQSRATQDEVRVSTIVGDRVCIGCGFNLTGQPVVKESRYGLFIARCPECGAVASLQEYPTLGKWANRWAAMAAALWLLVLAAGTFAFSMILMGTSLATVDEGLSDFVRWVHERAELDPESGYQEQSMQFYTTDVVDIAWWGQQDHWAMLREAGGFRRVILSEVVGVWFAILLGSLAFGVIASVALLHLRRWRLAFVLLLPIAIATVFQIAIYTNFRADMAFNTVAQPRELVRLMLAPLIFALTDGLAYFGVIVGSQFGRPVARGLMRAFLPPRLRSSLAFLWLADGKTPPKP